MPQGGTQTDLTPSLIARLSQAARYVINGVAPDAWMSPMQPLKPIEGQGAVGRAWDFPVGYNLDTRPRGYAPVGFEELRALAQSCDLVRLAIETRKDQIEALSWSVKPRALAARADDPRCAAISAFLQYPDGQNDWNQWLRALLEDLFVIDAASIYRRRDRAGRLHALQLIDGATLKPLIDDSGLRPLPPDPAFEQILKGVPKNLYTSAELLYLPRNVRTWSVYGYGPVEQIILTVNVALRRATSQLQYYTDGNMPDALVGLPTEWTADQMMSFQREWDAMLAGNQGQRRKGFFVPGEFKYQPLREPPLKDDFDEWLARIVCYAFSLPPTPFIKQMNRATAETAQQSALEEGLAPLLSWVKRCLDRVIAEDFDAPDLEFAWADDRAQDPQQAADIDVNYVKAGIKSVDEVRASLGLDPVGGAAAKPMLATPNGYVPVDTATTPIILPEAARHQSAGRGADAGGAAAGDNEGGDDDGPGNGPGNGGGNGGGKRPKPAPGTTSDASPNSSLPPEANNFFGATPQIQRSSANKPQGQRADGVEKFNPNHLPAGSPQGGQFTTGNSAGGDDDDEDDTDENDSGNASADGDTTASNPYGLTYSTLPDQSSVTDLGNNPSQAQLTPGEATLPTDQTLIPDIDYTSQFQERMPFSLDNPGALTTLEEQANQELDWTIPAYRADVFNSATQLSAWENFNRYVSRFGPIPANAYVLTYAAEGGRQLNPSSGAFAGIYPDFLSGVQNPKSDSPFRHDPLSQEVQGLNPEDLSNSQIGDLYDRVAREGFYNAGGRDALNNIGNADVAAAVYDTVFWQGVNGAPPTIQAAINDTLANNNLPQITEDGVLGKGNIQTIATLAANPLWQQQFLDNLAIERMKWAAQKYSNAPDTGKDRINFFRFLPGN